MYEKNRNAIPSWQGYHYQGQVAVLYILRYILDVFENRPSDVNKVFMKIEWLEDFTVFEEDRIKQIYQVKKIMDNGSYEDVIQNYIMEYKIANENVKFNAIYNTATEEKYKKIVRVIFDEIYTNFITNKIIQEINKLLENKNDLAYWQYNLKPKNKDSELKNIRGYVREFIDHSNLTLEKCKEIEEDVLKELLIRLESRDNYYEEFCKIYSFENVKIDTINNEIISLIDNYNLELPSFTPENVGVSIENKLSNDKSNFLIDIILDYKKKGRRWIWIIVICLAIENGRNQ